MEVAATDECCVVRGDRTNSARMLNPGGSGYADATAGDGR